MPHRILTSVDLPAPFSPMSAVTCPAYSCRLASLRARAPPKDFFTRVSVRMGCAGAGSMAAAISKNRGELLDVALIVNEGLGHGANTAVAESHRAQAPHRELPTVLGF